MRFLIKKKTSFSHFHMERCHVWQMLLVQLKIIKKYQNIRYIAKDANRSFLTVYVFIINFNVNDNKGNEKKNFIVTFIAVCRYLLRKSCVRGFFKIFPCSLNRVFNFSYIRFYIFRCFFQ